MQPVLSVSAMRQADAETIVSVTDSKELMRRAAQGIWENHCFGGRTAIVCGSGNNAGDGYALALLLHAAKIPCTVFLLSDRFSSDGRYYYEKCREIGVDIYNYTSETSLFEYQEIVDCIFGTGFQGEVSGIAADAIRKINASGAYVISADINSGLNGDNGQAELCVRSDLTVSIGYTKSGQFLGMAKDVIGKLCNVDIGIGFPKQAYARLEDSDVAEVFKSRPQNCHKGMYGYVSIMGGCTQYAGAVKLANMSCAALRAGCGVAQLIVPEEIVPSVSPYLLESTLSPMPSHNGKAVFDPSALDAALQKQVALSIGMGWGRSSEYAKILAHILNRYALSLVIDADGLNTLAEMDLSILKQTKCKVLLTPHLKEMERLCKITTDEILRDPIGVAADFAEKHRVLVLLKGPTTVVTDGANTFLVDRGCAGMATAGSGDVLSGILAGLFGYLQPDAFTVACGAYIAGLAGELAEHDGNAISMLASDTVSHIGAAISAICRGNV